MEIQASLLHETPSQKQDNSNKEHRKTPSECCGLSEGGGFLSTAVLSQRADSSAASPVSTTFTDQS